MPKNRGGEFVDLIEDLAHDTCVEGEPDCPRCELRKICPTGLARRKAAPRQAAGQAARTRQGGRRQGRQGPRRPGQDRQGEAERPSDRRRRFFEKLWTTGRPCLQSRRHGDGQLHYLEMSSIDEHGHLSRSLQGDRTDAQVPRRLRRRSPLAAPAFAAEKDIVDTAVAAGSFKTLVAAVKAAGLVDTLKGDGPFTVLAPTDEAFAKLPAGTVETLLKPENKDKLVADPDLPRHPRQGDGRRRRQARRQGGQDGRGQRRSRSTSTASTVMINNAKVIKTDIACTNGVIHVIDTVILPPAK